MSPLTLQVAGFLFLNVAAGLGGNRKNRITKGITTS